ncbi:MAG: hypothetical protein JW944_16285 [Deltaproteobacteria bacterium]|nr:hypothetical protein [Deltaproteobacteria bacterium]
MALVTAQAIKEMVLRTKQEMAPLRTGRVLKRTAVRILLTVLAAVFLCPVNPFMGILHAQEKDTILSDSGIVYPGGYDLNTVGDIKGKITGIVIPESGPVQLTLNSETETYIILASPGWYWEDMNAGIEKGTEITVRGSKSLGKNGKLYIIAQEIRMTGSKKTLSFRSEKGNALWDSGSQTGRTSSQKGGSGSSSGGLGSSSGGFGSSSGSRAGGASSGAGRGRR